MMIQRLLDGYRVDEWLIKSMNTGTIGATTLKQPVSCGVEPF